MALYQFYLYSNPRNLKASRIHGWMKSTYTTSTVPEGVAVKSALGFDLRLNTVRYAVEGNWRVQRIITITSNVIFSLCSLASSLAKKKGVAVRQKKLMPLLQY